MKQKEVILSLIIFLVGISILGCTSVDTEKTSDVIPDTLKESSKQLPPPSNLGTDEKTEDKIVENNELNNKAEEEGGLEKKIDVVKKETENDLTEDMGQLEESLSGEGSSEETSIEESKVIPTNSVALFFTEGLSSVKERLPVQVQYTNIEGGGYATNIQWESSTSAVLRYLPELEQVDLMKTGTSASWSQNSMYPFTTDGRFFVLRDWGSEWTIDNNQWTLTEINPKTGVVLQETGFNADSFAIIDNAIYLSTGKTTDFYGKVTSYGKLKVMDLGEGSSYYAKDLYSFSMNVPAGQIYGVGDYLMSLAGEYVDGEYIYSIRKHSLLTGEPTILFDQLRLTDFSRDHVFPGEDSLYIGIEYNGGIWFQKFTIQGESTTVPVELERLGSTPRGFLTEDDGKLIIAEADGHEIKTLSVFDSKTEELEQITIEPFQADVSFSRVGFPALIVD